MKSGFEAIPLEDDESLLPRKENDHALGSRLGRTTIHHSYYLLSFLVGLIIAGSVGVRLGHYWGRYQTLLWSPLMLDMDIRYDQMIKFNGSFIHENVFRGDAGPDVDSAWDAVGFDWPVLIPSEIARKSGLLPHQVQVSKKHGGGYPAYIEGLHHLHCLNLLRQALYYNFDYYHSRRHGAFKNDDNVLRLHVSHCLDTLRQQLMCTVETGVLGEVWWNKDHPTPYPDFNTRHKCKNFDAIRQWAENHQVPREQPPDYLKIPRDDDISATIP